MNRLGAYGAYQNNLMDSFVKNKKEAEKNSAAGKAERTEKAAKGEAAKKTASETELS